MKPFQPLNISCVFFFCFFLSKLLLLGLFCCCCCLFVCLFVLRKYVIFLNIKVSETKLIKLANSHSQTVNICSQNLSKVSISIKVRPCIRYYFEMEPLTTRYHKKQKKHTVVVSAQNSSFRTLERNIHTEILNTAATTKKETIKSKLETNISRIQKRTTLLSNKFYHLKTSQSQIAQY